jgi:YesN/AraC family two-component response regulator
MYTHSDASESALQQNEQMIKDVKLYIMEHYSEFNLSLNTLAEKFHTSPNVLGRIFKALAGRPVFQYITQIRLQHAQDFLLHSTLTNKEIALACGFENTSYFYSLFKQELGTTPSEFRKSHKT